MHSITMHDERPIALTFLDFELHPSEGLLRKSGLPIDLQPKVFSALVFFAMNPDRLVSKQELLDALWPDTVVEEASLTQVIHKLRRVLGESNGAPRVLHTALKRGFRFTAEVRPVFAPPKARAPDPPDTSDTPEPTPAPTPTPTPEPTPTPTPTPEPTPTPTPTPTPEPTPEPTPTSTPTPKSEPTPRRPRLAALALAATAATALTVALLASPAPSTAPPSPSPLHGDPTSRLVSRLTRLPERDQEPDLAPDLTWFAFASKRGTDGGYALWVQRLDGGEPVQITRPPRGEDTTPRVFPDGRAIAFTRCQTTNPHAPGCSVWRVAPLGGDERLLVPDCNLGDLHPDAPTLVCMRGTEDGHVAFIDAALDDSRPPTTLHKWAGPLETLRLSRAGDLAFLSTATPYVLPAATRRPTRLFAAPANVHTLAFTPAGDHLLLDLSKNGRRTLWAAPLDTLPVAETELLPLTLGSGVDLYPDLAADGSVLLYAHETNESVLYVVDPEGRNPRRLDTRTSFLGHSLGSLGHHLAVWDADAPSSGDDTALLELTPLIGTMEPDPPSPRTPLTSSWANAHQQQMKGPWGLLGSLGPSSASVDTSGRSETGRGPTASTATLRGLEQTPHPTSPCVSAPPGDENAWRPIESLARLRPAPPRACDRTSRRSLLTARGLGTGTVPALSPDESKVALVDRAALILVDLTHHRRTTLVTNDVREVRPAFAPNGRQLAFAVSGDSPGLALYRLDPPPLREEARSRLVAHGHFTAPTFSPDGRYVLASGSLLDTSTSGLYLVDLQHISDRADPHAPIAPRLLSTHRSYEAAPLFLPTHPDLAWVLIDERTAPRLMPVALSLTLELPTPIALEVPPDPANWGVFDIAAHPSLGFIYLLKKVHSDIMMVRAPPASNRDREP